MKIEKFREMTLIDLQRKLAELQDSLLKTRIKVQTKQVENTAQLGSLRRDIARGMTILREMERQGVRTPLAAAAPAEAPTKAPAKAPKAETPAAPKAKKPEKAAKAAAKK
jgi:large subunit ribosomal protein L29